MAKNDDKNTDAKAKTTETETKADDAAETETKAEESNASLVKVTKAGQTLYVHPLTLKAHEAAGWKA